MPIARFSQLTVDEITQQLRTLSQSDPTVIEGYERAHGYRRPVLDAIEQLRGPEPWDGYDTMDENKITAQLQSVPSSVARQVLEYVPVQPGEARRPTPPPITSRTTAQANGQASWRGRSGQSCEGTQRQVNDRPAQ